MASRSSNSRNSKSYGIEKSSPSFVSVQLLRDTTYKIRGDVTGKEYIFNGAGSIINVDSRDVPKLLSIMTNRSCCGGQIESHSIFRVIRD